MGKRKPEIVVISDVHLGTYGCQAGSLHKYLKSIDPEILILNGDIIDIWQFNKWYWPKSHTKVLQRIFKMLAEGTRVYYLTGNHDELLRKYTDLQMANLHIANKLILDLDGKKAWFFHGDVFDITMKSSRWLAKLGGIGYDILIMLNSVVNWFSQQLGRGKISLSKKIKSSVKSAVRYISDFEETAIQIAMEKGYDFVVCGHIHQPVIREVQKDDQSLTYLNSGDWIENLTALEYQNGAWSIHHYEETEDEEGLIEEQEAPHKLSIQALFQNIVSDTGS